jgi:3-phosphoshikimate 1-carboxyvinyltransferase
MGSDTIRVGHTQRLRGTIAVPGDKSIAHRALLFGALAHGWTRVVGLPRNADVGATIDTLGACGVLIQRNAEAAIVQGCGFESFRPNDGPIDCANSGTTMRLLTGILAGLDRGKNAGTDGNANSVVLMGDASLSRRPMRRIAEPLAKMGASISLSENGTAPIRIVPKRLHAADHELTVPSAQVKTALIFAGLFAEGTTRIGGAIVSRDHTERMLPIFCGRLELETSQNGNTLVVPGRQKLEGAFVRVPGDPSSAAFWIAAGLLVHDGDIVLRNIGANPSRVAFVDIVRRMGANVDVDFERMLPEPVATLRVRSSELRAVTLEATEVASAVDELPLVAVLATQARGTTIVRNARELRVKESDRIETTASMLRALGAEVETFDDGFAIEGQQHLHGGRIESHGDHRIAMAGAIAALLADGECEIAGASSAAVSYPAFFSTLAQLGGKVT